MRALNIAATGMLAQQLNVEVIANNISNMTTTAYKRQRAEFQDIRAGLEHSRARGRKGDDGDGRRSHAHSQ